VKLLGALALAAGLLAPLTAHARSTAIAAEVAPAAQEAVQAQQPGAKPAPGDDEIVGDGIDIVERLGERAAIDVPLVDQNGKVVRMRDYLGKRPVMLALVYYRCSVLCNLLLQGVAKVMQQIDWRVGQDFEVLTVSVDPMDTTELAKEKRRGFLQAAGRPEEEQKADGAWPFFTASTEAIDVLAASVGFRFKYIARERQFAHIAALFFLSPEGKLTRYLYGVQFDPKEVKLALFESAQGRVGTALERVMLRCYKFDPAGRKYHLFVRTYYRVWGVLIILALGTFLGVLWRRELKRPAPKPPTDDTKGES
jgi:protein SCO1/2